MTLPLFIINAFTAGPFTGNPAAVVVSEETLAADLMQRIAAQNNLSETAFVILGQQPLALRWFTPTVEVDLCGHATLAAAHVLLNHGYVAGETITFATLSGELGVRRVGPALQLNFPARLATPVDSPSVDSIAAALGCPVESIECCLKSNALVVVLREEAVLARIQPTFAQLKPLDRFGIVVTAASHSVDFVTRVFAPNVGIDEDPVTGSIYTTLAPYWADRLGKAHLAARQLSQRGGAIECEVQGERVLIGGQVEDYLAGQINIKTLVRE